MSGLSVGFTTSFAEELAKAFPGVKIVKAFNTLFAQVLNEGPDFGKGLRASAFYCDDETARKTVHGLSRAWASTPSTRGRSPTPAISSPWAC